MALIRGTVRDGSGRPVAGAVVFVVSAPRPAPDVGLLADERGRFVVAAPVLGDYVLGARSSTSGPKHVSVHVAQAADTHVEIVLD